MGTDHDRPTEVNEDTNRKSLFPAPKTPYIHDPSEQKPIKNFVEKQRGRIQGLPNFLSTVGYPLLSQERV